MLGTRGSHKQRTNMHTVTCSLATYTFCISTLTHTYTHSHMLTCETHVILCTHTHSHSHKTTCLVSHKEQGSKLSRLHHGPGRGLPAQIAGTPQGNLVVATKEPFIGDQADLTFLTARLLHKEKEGGHNRECIANGSPLETLSHQNSSQG